MRLHVSVRFMLNWLHTAESRPSFYHLGRLGYNVPSKHSGVHSAFGQHFVKTGLFEPEYHHMLINAFQVRVDSDYNVELAPAVSSAQDILQDATRFVNRSIIYLQQEGHL